VLSKHKSQERQKDYGHSLSIRQDLGGVAALRELGPRVFADLEALVTPSLGFTYHDASLGGSDMLVVDTSWFGSNSSGLRLMRYDLWRTLRDVAVRLSDVAVLYNAKVDTAEIIDGRVNLSTSNNEVFLCTGIVVAADGHRSAVRRSLCAQEGALHFLGVSIVARQLQPSQVPAIAHKQHGLIVGPPGSALFVADEDDHFIAALSITTDVPLTSEMLQSDAALRARFRANIDRYPEPWRKMLDAFRDDAIAPRMIVNCHDHLPTPPLNNAKVVFIGDASHAVSPFAGAGANMALLDGVDLANAVRNAANGDVDVSVLKQFFETTRKSREKTVMGQRRNVDWWHTSVRWKIAVRTVMHVTLAALLHPVHRRKLLMVGAAAAVAFVAYGFSKTLTTLF
jgi:2-polyprenyl-6-methoxyphenol hydroxylase-like FAD-dependent oxidoreductase